MYKKCFAFSYCPLRFLTVDCYTTKKGSLCAEFTYNPQHKGLWPIIIFHQDLILLNGHTVFISLLMPHWLGPRIFYVGRLRFDNLFLNTSYLSTIIWRRRVDVLRQTGFSPAKNFTESLSGLLRNLYSYRLSWVKCTFVLLFIMCF